MVGRSGVLVRVNGQRINRVKLLQQDVAALSAKIQQLDQQNALLRAKETAQMGVLRSYEDSLHFMGVLMSEMADDDYGHNSEDMSFLAAAMLDLQAMELLKQLSPPPGDPVTAPSSSSSPPHVSTPSSCGGGGQLCNVGVGGGGSTTSTTTTTTTTSSSGQAALQESSRSQRLWSCLTSDAVLTMRGISTRDLADSLKAIVSRMALLKHCNNMQLSDSLEAATDTYGVTLLLSMAAADQQLLECTCLNLDSMQPEPPPEGFWAKVVDKANLQPQQRNQVFWVFECYQDQRAALLQQQQHIVEALQQLLGPDNSANSTADAVTPAEREQPAPGAPASDGVTVPAASLSVGLSDLQRQSQGGECAEASTISGTAAAGPACARMSACDSSKASSMFPGMLDLEVAEEVEQLLQQLQRVVRLQRESSRRLVLLWMDLLTSEQHVDAILAAYPFTVKVPAVCAWIWQEHQAALATSGCNTAGAAVKATATPAATPSAGPRSCAQPSSSGPSLQGAGCEV